jgi:hypothetical protein
MAMGFHELKHVDQFREHGFFLIFYTYGKASEQVYK